MVDVRLGHIGVKVLALDETQEELVDDLDVRPGHFQHGFVLLGIKSLALRRNGRWNGTKQVLGKHLDDPRIHGFGDNGAVVGDIVEEFVQGQPFDFLGLHIGGRVVKVEDDVALIDLLHEEILATVGRHFVEARKLFELSLALVGDIKSRRVLAFGGSDAFGHILWCSLETIENVRFPGRSQITRHRLGRARGRNMLIPKNRSQTISQKEMRTTEGY